jgi:hypothetical protein
MRSSVRGRNQFVWQLTLLASVVAVLVAFRALGVLAALAIFVGMSLGVGLGLRLRKRRPR